jgi:peptide-methionine (R)-S-oxide reductase
MKQQSEDKWKEKLTEEQYEIMRLKGTEAPFTGKLLHNDKEGKYYCAACGAELFSSDKKFDSGSGWPSFYDAKLENIELRDDLSLGIIRTEVICKKCKSHLGHLFNDAPQTETGQRYCVNSASLKFKEKK